MKKIVIGGVPEHFNLPWLDALARQDPEQTAFAWEPQPQGTGAMVAGLAGGQLDAALLLTEGAVAAFAGGAAFDITAVYVETPLEWGIHVPADSPISDVAAIRGARYAISRRGSGSHLMSIAHARSLGWPLDSPRFQSVGTIEGAREAFATGRADVFFWERVMTQPLVDAGEFRRVGLFAAPWPAFVLCIAGHVADDERARIKQLLDRVLQCARAFKADSERSAARITVEFGIEPEEALRWLERTQWADRIALDKAMLRGVAEVLREAELIDAMPEW